MQIKHDPEISIDYTFIMSEDIVICKVCNGSGVTHTTSFPHHHNGDIDEETTLCHKCDGDGRYIEVRKLRRAEVSFNNDFAKCDITIKKITPDTNLLDRPSSYIKYNQKLTKKGKLTQC